MSLKLALCMVALCVVFQLNAKPAPYKDEFTLPTDSQELIDEYLERVHKIREEYGYNCTGFVHEWPFAPFSHPKIDYEHWYELCWNFQHVYGYFPKFMKPIRARIIKEVREEFAKKEE